MSAREHLVVKQVEAVVGLRLRLAIELLLKGPDLVGCFKTHRQSPSASSPSSKACRKSGPFPPPALPGLNGRMDLSDPRSSRHLTWRSGLRTPPARVSPDNPHCLAGVPCPLPRRTRTGALTGFLPRSARPSPKPRWVGIRIATFEACSGFTRYGPQACSTALRRPLSQGSDPCGYPHKPPVSYSIKPVTIEVESSSTGNTRLPGALGLFRQNAGWLNMERTAAGAHSVIDSAEEFARNSFRQKSGEIDASLAMPVCVGREAIYTSSRI
jgi:hypothetical protein